MRDPLHWMSVKHKLSLAFAGLCLLAFGVGGFLISRSARAALEEQIEARIEFQCLATARALGEHLRLLARRTEDFASDGYLRERSQELVAATDPETRTELTKLLRDHLSQNKLPLVPAFCGLTLVDASGAVLVHADDGDSPPMPGVIRDALAAPGLLHSDLLPPRDGAALPRQAISTPLRRLDGRGDVGRLVAWVDPAIWVAATLSEIQPDAASAAARHTPVSVRIVDRAGRSLAPVDAAPHRGAVRLRFLSEPVAPDPAPNSMSAQRFSISENDWSVHMRLRGMDVFAPVSGLQSRFLGVGVVLALLCGVLTFFPMRFLVRPLGQLREAARRIRAGDYTVRVGGDSTDEVGELARSFDHMAEAVEQKTTRLQRAAEELRAGQRELRRQHERLDIVIRTLHDGLIVLDGDGTPVLVNDAARPLVELLQRGDERLTSHYVCRSGDALGNCTHCLLERTTSESSCVLDVGERVYEVRVSQLPPDRASPDQRGPVGVGRVLVARDITERLSRDERDIHRERLSVLGEVAAVMAHELNNPLTSVRMFAQMLADALPAESPLREHAQVIVRNTETCRRSIAELLGYAHDATPESGPVTVHDVLLDVVRFVRPLAERARATVETELSAEHDVVNGDEIQIRQLFVNLVLNAVQAAPGTGVVVTIATRTEAGTLVAEVRDTGPGLDDEARARAFDAFFSTKPRGEGTGLGLPTARRIAELHGGGIELLDSAPGHTVFRVRLRAASLPSPSTADEVAS